jgi:tRNA nucleotidyltransferase (CCA-adding enzyme)
LERKPPFGLSDLALNGEDIMTMFNLSPGPTVGQMLDHLLEKVLDVPEDNTKEILLKYAREYYLKLPEVDINANDKDSDQ